MAASFNIFSRSRERVELDSGCARLCRVHPHGGRARTTSKRASRQAGALLWFSPSNRKPRRTPQSFQSSKMPKLCQALTTSISFLFLFFSPRLALLDYSTLKRKPQGKPTRENPGNFCHPVPSHPIFIPIVTTTNPFPALLHSLSSPPILSLPFPFAHILYPHPHPHPYPHPPPPAPSRVGKQITVYQQRTWSS